MRGLRPGLVVSADDMDYCEVVHEGGECFSCLVFGLVVGGWIGGWCSRLGLLMRLLSLDFRSASIDCATLTTPPFRRPARKRVLVSPRRAASTRSTPASLNALVDARSSILRTTHAPLADACFSSTHSRAPRRLHLVTRSPPPALLRPARQCALRSTRSATPVPLNTLADARIMVSRRTRSNSQSLLPRARHPSTGLPHALPLHLSRRPRRALFHAGRARIILARVHPSALYSARRVGLVFP